MTGSPSSSGTRPSRTRSSAQSPALSDLDRRILYLVSFLRVLTVPQLARSMSPETPPRTIRYRTARLAKLGLVGRTRPYRERGSAPHHLWPTRKGEAIAEGSPPPRGGERREPNPLFLAHAAAISELYVSLKTELPEGFRLTGFEREAEAREAFRGYDGKEHAVAPDAAIRVTDPNGLNLFGMVELDLGTMSTRQLKSKAEGYGEYARLDGWRQTYPFCPALLFLTTSEKRTHSFLTTCEKAVGRHRMFVAASGLARDIASALVEPAWLAGEDERGDLITALRAARRPFDKAQEREEAQQREDDEERHRLRSDPEALAGRLRDELRRGWGRDQLGEVTTGALLLSAESADTLDTVERTAFAAVAGMLEDPLRLSLEDRELNHSECAALDALVSAHRRSQLRILEDLAERFGVGPTLRERQRQLDGGELLPRSHIESLPQYAERDRNARAEQDRLRDEYLSWREQEARRRGKLHGVIERRRISRDAFLREVDKDALRRCRGCEEIAYPDPENASSRARRQIAERCHFCRGLAATEIDPDEGPA